MSSTIHFPSASIAAAKVKQPIARVLLVRGGEMEEAAGWWRAPPHDSALCTHAPRDPEPGPRIRPSPQEEEDLGHASRVAA
jgi:hypothetical protein